MVDVLRPGTFAEASNMLAENAGAVALAGGTDVLLDMRTGRSTPDLLVDLTAVAGSREIVASGDSVRLGALTTIRSIELNEALAQRATALVEAARVLGSVQIRVMATVGGNLCHATPSAEMPPSLLVHDANAEITGPGGDRTVTLQELFVGPGRTSLGKGELLAGLTFEVADNLASCYLRQTVRWSMDLAGVGVAASVRADGDKIVTATVALGAVAPTPIVVSIEDAGLLGTVWDDDAARRAGELAAAAASPISDARGSADYRRSVIAALVPRALGIAFRRASGRWPAGRLSPTNGLPIDGAVAGVPA